MHQYAYLVMCEVCGEVEAGSAHPVGDVDVGHGGDEEAHAGDGVVGRRHVRRRLPVLVPRVLRRTVGEQHLHALLEENFELLFAHKFLDTVGHLSHLCRAFAIVRSDILYALSVILIFELMELSVTYNIYILTSFDWRQALCNGVSHLLSLAFTLASPSLSSAAAISFSKNSALPVDIFQGV